MIKLQRESILIMLKTKYFQSKLILLGLLLFLFSSVSLATAQYSKGGKQGKVKIYYEKVKAGQYKFYARNNNYAPYQVKLSFTQLKNMNLNTNLPFYDVVAAQTKKQYLFTATAQENKSYSFKYNYKYLLGNPNQVQVTEAAYLLPYQHGEKHKVTQGYNGDYSHQGKLALDFAMNRGTPITAARSGLVVQMKENSSQGGPSRRYLRDANYIIIYHDDGTFAEYAHLQYNGAVVEIGERVKAGEVIAYSGNTGWSRGPHLHFQVFKPLKMRRKTIATDFLNHKQQQVRIEAGKYYYSYHPGSGDYKVKLGRELSNQDYQNHRKSVAATGQLSLTTNKVDDTVVLFIKNGYQKEIKVKINFKQANNIRTSKPVPFSKVVPATTEVYAFLIKPKDYNQTWNYSLQYRYSH